MAVRHENRLDGAMDHTMNQSKSGRTVVWRLLVGWVFLGVILTGKGALAYSRETRWNHKAWAEQQHTATAKRLTDAQLRVLAHQAVNRFMQRAFFKHRELPDLSVLSKFDYVGEFPGHAMKLTDMVLNRFLDSSRMIIVNQDLTTDLSVKMSFKLMSYDPPSIARHKGMLMGANYIIAGTVNESEVSPRGTPQRELRLELTLSDIRSGEVVVREQVIKYFK